jgi:hypothetical protein
MRNRNATRRRQPDEPKPIDVREWLEAGLLAESVPVPDEDGAWPPAVLDGQPFPLAAAFLGLLHALGPVEHPVPHRACSTDEQLRARRLASELHALLALDFMPVDWQDCILGDYD